MIVVEKIDSIDNIKYYLKTVLGLEVPRIIWTYKGGGYYIDLYLTDGDVGSIFPVRNIKDPSIIDKYLVTVNDKIMAVVLPDEFEVIKPILVSEQYNTYIYHMYASRQKLKRTSKVFSKLAKIFINTAYTIHGNTTPYMEFNYVTSNNISLTFRISKN